MASAVAGIRPSYRRDLRARDADVGKFAIVEACQFAHALIVAPPRPDQPLVDSKERKFAHSERFVLPRITAPLTRRFAATVESFSAGVPSNANDPAVVCILS